MKKVLFIDRDGTILGNPSMNRSDSLEDFEFIPGVIHSPLCYRNRD
jgi:histidinol phosphatase-like enzyme